jgi:hypothetical protein
MAAVANNPKFAKKAGVSSAVGKEFLTADKGKTFKEGGAMKHSDMSKDKPMMKKVAAKAVKGHEKKLHGMKAGGMAKGGGCEIKGKTKGKMIKMRTGGTC